MEIKKFKEFKNGKVYCLKLNDGKLIETTDTFLPFYTKFAINENTNKLKSNVLGDRNERWMIGVSCMSGCPCHCQFCLVPGTKVLKSDFSLVNIEDIMIGDEVLSNVLTKSSNSVTSYSSSFYRNAKVLNLFKRKYSGDIVTITTEKGKKLTLTPNHKIAIKNNLYRRKYVNASEIHKGDIIYTFQFENNINLHNNEEWIIGWLYGFIKGDGVYTKNTGKQSYKTSVSQSNNLIFYAHEKINQLFGKTSIITEYKYDNENHKTSYRFSFGEKTYNSMMKRVNEVINNDNFKKGFISGFWDAEGFSFKNNNIARVCNNDINLLNLFNKFITDLGFKEGKIKDYMPKNNNLVLDTSINRMTFCTFFQPFNDKKNFLKNNVKIKDVCDKDIVKTIEINYYDGFVYNIETSEHTYIANDVLVHNCATGQMKGYRNLTANEIVEQVEFIINNNPEYNPNISKEFKINYTRMGEPFLNIENVKKAIEIIDSKYNNVHHYISTIGVIGSDFSWIKDNITLQISLHSFNENTRNELIPFKNKMTIEELGKIRTSSNLKTTVNLTLVDVNDFDINMLKKYFNPKYFFIKLSPLNPNVISDKNHLSGIIHSDNIL